MRVRSRFAWAFIVAITIISSDQVLKSLVVDYFRQGPQRITVAPFFDFILTWNRGVSFGLLRDMMGQWALIGVGLVITMVLIQWLRRAENGLQVFSLALIIGGAVGNIIDRFRFGAVVDYLLFHIHDYHFPAFNLADAAISIGVVMLLYEHLTSRPPSSLKFLTKKR